MKSIIRSAKFIKGVVDEDTIMYDGTPHIAFIGRSNVGKSSTINKILERKKLVKTGNTPGKTREINFFNVQTNNDQHCYFVDLPGYGYAKLSKSERKKLRELIVWYISHPGADTSLICLIIDAKAGLTDLDRDIIHILDQSSKQYIIAVNKIDKINQKEQSKLKKDLGKNTKPETQIFYYSATKEKNIHLLQEFLLHIEK